MQENNKIGSGLHNLGNTCFFNAVTQVMLHTESLAAALQAKTHSTQCQKQKWCVLCSMEDLWAQSKKARVVSPNNIVGNLKNIFKKFRLGRQEDSHQFLRYLVQGIQEAETGKLGKDREKNELTIAKTLAYRVFGGKMRTFVHCLSCHHRSLTSERYYDINIECQKSNSLQEGLANFFKVDELHGANKYRCDNCKQMSNAKKGFRIVSVPKVMTFQLKRFTNTMRKIGKHIQYPKEIDVNKYLQDSEKNWGKLQLFGVVVHAGGSSYSGHYYSFVKNGKDWYEMNDSSVTRVSEDRALSQQAYLLFYKRTSNIQHEEHEAKSAQIEQSEVKRLQTHPNEQISEQIRRRKKSHQEMKANSLQKNGNGRKRSLQMSEQDLEETKRKLSMDISSLIKQAHDDKETGKIQSNNHHPKPKNSTSNGVVEIAGKTLHSPVFGSTQKPKKEKKKDGQGDSEDQFDPPPRLGRKRSKGEAMSAMTLLQIVMKYSQQMLALQSKLPRRGPGHRAMSPMYKLRKYEIAMKRRKLP